jgi:hypothetical protein
MAKMAAKTKTTKKTTKATKVKKVKDPNAPKRPLSAYMFFAKDQRAAILKKNPSFGVTDVAKALGAQWAKTTDKSKYEKEAAKDKARYEAAMAKYKK